MSHSPVGKVCEHSCPAPSRRAAGPWRAAETREDRHTNDTHTAADMNTFLRRWLEAYPEFQRNDFFVSGESYAGVYVPLVTQVGRQVLGACAWGMGWGSCVCVGPLVC